MFARFVFLLITLFWVTMNVLLWRAEYSEQYPARSPVPVAVVWRKILTAPDSSSLNILVQGKRVGFFHWSTSVAEEFAQLEEAPPEGMLKKMENYRIQFDGSASVPDVIKWFRFACEVKLSSKQVWQELTLRLRSRPNVVEIHATAADQSVHFKLDDGESQFERVFRFAELQNPETLLRELGGPFADELLEGFVPQAVTQEVSSPALDVKWEAYLDAIRIRHESVPIYRLEAQVLGRYPMAIYVSRVGEILRAELPGGIVLVHDLLSNN